MDKQFELLTCLLLLNGWLLLLSGGYLLFELVGQIRQWNRHRKRKMRLAERQLHKAQVNN